MNIISLKCPACNAPLQINSELSQASCNYCGCQFVMEDELKREREAGLAYERGRMDAAASVASETAEKLHSLMGPINELNRLSDARNEADKDMQQTKERIAAYAKPTTRILLFAAGGVSMVLSIVLGGGIGFLIGLALLGGFVLAGCGQQRYAESQTQKEEAHLQQIEEEQKQREERMKTLLAENDVDFLPVKYRTNEAMKYMYTALTGQRAINLTQAINLYEEELHHQQIYEMQQEQIRIQQEQLEAQKAQLVEQKKQTKKLEEMEDERHEDAAGKIVGSIVTTGLGIAIGKGIGKIFDDLL